jgi:peptidyl-prolyl cis-trans isomerase D
MALIGKIREKSWLLIAVIGIAMLAFILGDFDLFNKGPREDIYGIGTVNGEKVNEQEYQNVLNNVRNNLFQSKQQQNPGQRVEFTAQDEKNALSQAWQAVVADKLVNEELEKIGLIVDDFELENVLYGENGFNPSTFSTQFKDSVTGEFAPDQLRQSLSRLEESNKPDEIKQYQQIMDYVRQMRTTEKYTTLLSAGVHATTLEGKHEYNAKQTVKNVSYVYQNFTKVPEQEIGEVTDEEIKAYYAEHKGEEKYKQRASRNMVYFAIPVAPSNADSSKAMDLLQRVKPKFKEAENDSLFVLRFSDVKQFSSDSTAIARPEGPGQQGMTYPASIAQDFENAEQGDVVGPYSSGRGVMISKILRFEEEPTATVRHILLSANDEVAKKAANKQADSILAVIRSKNNFESMVTEFSDDPGSVNNGGKYENFTEGKMVPPFNDFSFDKPIGTLGKVETSYGVHIIEVLGRESVKRPVIANIVKNIEPSKITVDDVKSQASEFIYELDDLMTDKSIEEKRTVFDTFVVENGYNIRKLTMMDDEPQVTGFSDLAQGDIMRLGYGTEAKEGAVSSAPIRDNNRIVIAMLTEIIEEGEPSFEAVKGQMKGEVVKQKQAQYLVDQMVGRDDLQPLATELNAQYQTEGLTFSASNVAVGKEPKIIGTAFSGLIDGQKSVPVIGNSGVFVLRVENTQAAEETTDFSTEISQINSQRKSQIGQRYRTALLTGAEVIDNRKLRNYGIRY